MNSIISFIKRHYQLNECEYFDQDDADDEIYDNSQIFLMNIVKKFKYHFSTDFQINETKIQTGESTILIKFSYKEYSGKLEDIYCSRGFYYWKLVLNQGK